MEKTKEFGFMSINYITAHFKNLPENRCYLRDFEEGRKNNYSDTDVKRLNARIKKYKKFFKTDGEWALSCAMKVYECNGEFYIVDGQGRYLALLEYNKTAEKPITMVPVDFFMGYTYDEIVAEARRLNMGQKGWTVDDMFRCSKYMAGDKEAVREMISRMNYIKNMLDVKDYTAKLIIYGESRASHRDLVNENTEFAPYWIEMCGAFNKVYSAIGSDRHNRCYNVIRKQDAAQAFYKIFNRIIRYSISGGLDFRKELDFVADKLRTYISNMTDDKVLDIFAGKESAISRAFMGYLKRYIRRKVVVEAMSAI